MKLLVLGITTSNDDGVAVVAIGPGLIVKPRDAEWTVRA
jgi:hypothetical protein